MNNWKKYGKNIIAFLITVLLVVLGIFFGIKFVKFFMPFAIGWVIALIANPLVRLVESKMNVARKHTSMVIIIAVLAVIVSVIYFASVKIAEQVGDLIEQAPSIYSSFGEDFASVEQNLDRFIKELPEDVQISIDDFQNDLGAKAGAFVGKVSQWTMDNAGDIAKHLPNVLISVIFTILSAYFFIADREKILEFGRENMPEFVQEKWRMLSDNMKIIFGGYFKAQFKIMAIICVILFIGFLILDVKFAILVAILVSFLDMLPFLGTGTMLIPWALFKILSNDLKFAIGLIILYLVTQLVRRMIEPKMVGDSIGMNPLLTLIFMYTGYRISGVLGMILAVPIGALIINFYEAGLFAKPLKDIREACNDFYNWLYKEN